MFRQMYAMYITSDLCHSIFTAERERNCNDLLISGSAVPNLFLYPRCQLHPDSKGTWQTGWDLSGGTKSARTYDIQSETLTILGFFPSSLPSISHVPRAKPLWVIMICGMSRPSRQAKPGKSIDAQGHCRNACKVCQLLGGITQQAVKEWKTRGLTPCLLGSPFAGDAPDTVLRRTIHTLEAYLEFL